MQCVEEGYSHSMMLNTHYYLKKLLQKFLHYNVEKEHHDLLHQHFKFKSSHNIVEMILLEERNERRL